MYFRLLGLILIASVVGTSACDQPVKDVGPVPRGLVQQLPIAAIPVNTTLSSTTLDSSGDIGTICVPSDCGESTTCGYWACKSGACAFIKAANTVACDDGDACTYGEKCNGAGACGTGTR